MKYNPNIHHRRSIRLQHYDYSQEGMYFITIGTYNRQPIFGDVIQGQMVLNKCGKIAQQCWLEIPNHYPNVQLDEYIIMPNHVYGIIIINNVGVQNIVGVQDVEPLRKQNQFQHIIPKSIGSIVRGFKIGVTKWFRQNTDIYNVWQRNYYEHIIRDDDELNRIREYIINNPLQWEQEDKYFYNIQERGK